MTDTHTAVVVSILVVCSVFAGFVGVASADHGAENGNYTVNLPHPSDHWPRQYNDHNASINHFAAGTREVFDKKEIPKGMENMSFIVVLNKDIDFSQCTTSNTAAFGIDRDSDDPGTKTDVDLLTYRESSQFRNHSIVVDFYEGDELAARERQDKGGQGHGEGEGREDGDKNAEFYPDDQIVAHQGYKSAGGACYGMPKEPGWYQIQGYLNGTGFNGKFVNVSVPSHYFYICLCNSTQEAREQLGPKPSNDSATTPVPTDTPTATPSPTATPVETPTPPPQTPTPTPERRAGGETQTTQAGGGGNDGGDNGGGDDGGGGQQQSTATARQAGNAVPATAVPETPTIAEGPGFGAAVSLFALAGAALLAARRD